MNKQPIEKYEERKMIPLPQLTVNDNSEQADLVRRQGVGIELAEDSWYTIQGEGPFSGVPAIFIRLAGCNLQCPHCDTDYTSNRFMASVHDVVTKVTDAMRNYQKQFNKQQKRLVVITGGEPFRQQALYDLVFALLYNTEFTIQVQIETNGTLFNPQFDEDYPILAQNPNLSIVISPKTPVIHDRWKKWIMNNEHTALVYFKYIIAKPEADEDSLGFMGVLGNGLKAYKPTVEQSHEYAQKLYDRTVGRVFLQPEVPPVDLSDPSDPEHKRYLENERYTVDLCGQTGNRLSIQLHKVVGVK